MYSSWSILHLYNVVYILYLYSSSPQVQVWLCSVGAPSGPAEHACIITRSGEFVVVVSEAEIRSRTWQKWTFFERAAGEAKLLNNYIHERCDGNL